MGDWKLGGFEVLSTMKDPSPVLYVSHLQAWPWHVYSALMQLAFTESRRTTAGQLPLLESRSP
jgi:hypothetical protein